MPLFVRGPGITAGQVINDSAVHVDLAPTILDMMGMASTPEQMDGRSWLGLVRPSSRAESSRAGDPATRTFMIEYSGGGDPEGEHLYTLATPRAAFCTADASDENSIVGQCSCTFGAGGELKHDQSPCDGANNTCV